MSEANRIKCRKYRSTHLEALRARNREWYYAHREEMSRSAREWYHLNKDRASARNKVWRELHAAERREYNRKRTTEKRNNDPAFKILMNLRNQVNRYVKQFKAYRTIRLIGCTPLELKAHLEAQFLPGMSWDNHGAWHIDHKRPCAAFDLTDPAQQKECFHWSNLQPLWAAENRAKGAKIIA